MEARPGVPRPTFYTVQEAAAILRVCENHIRAGIRSGAIPGRKIGRAYRVSARFFDEESQTSQPERAPRSKSHPSWP